MKKVGLLINPIAGMGGRVGLKGTDGPEIFRKAVELVAKPEAEDRAISALKVMISLQVRAEWCVYSGPMGETACRACELSPTVLGHLDGARTDASDTRRAAQDMLTCGVDLLLFAGGDGTARDIYQEIGDTLTVLGIPAGVKIQSAVFAASPEKAGELASLYLEGKAGISQAEIMDLDEDEYRKGIVTPRLHGYFHVPYEKRYLQGPKVRTGPGEAYYQEAIAAEVIENLSEDFFYIIGPGTTTRPIMEKLGIEYTLLGIDLIHQKRLVGKDLNEFQLLEKIEAGKVKLVVTPIGGQGHLFGRGNQPLSPRVLRTIGKENIFIVATPQKIHSLRGRSLLVDTGDAAVDAWLSGYYRVITGYRESIIYKVAR